MNAKKPYLSIVVTSRNDNHGGDLLFRMQHFVNGAIHQCNRFKIVSELIIVEWNPPHDRPPLVNALEFPVDNSYCKVRIITVPAEVHSKMKYSDKLPLFQMIGKNVGVRRAKGEYVLATNIDVIFTDDVMDYIKHKLKPGCSYRVDRFDVRNNFPKTNSVVDVLGFCEKNILNINTRYGSFSTQSDKKSTSQSIEEPPKKSLLAKFANYLKRSFSVNPIRFGKNLFVNFCAKVIYTFFLSLSKLNVEVLMRKSTRAFFLHTSKLFIPLNTNACGDFALMSAEDWKRLRGYPEWELYSWHIDGIFLYQAKQHGIKEIDLGKYIYHIDHEGGFIVDSPSILFQRLDTRGIGYIDNEELKRILTDLETAKEKRLFNDLSWGLGDQNLEEMTV